MSRYLLQRMLSVSRESLPGILCSALFGILLSTTMDLAAIADVSASSLSNDLSQLEEAFFEHDYAKEEASARLDRLERFVFGEVRSGSEQKRLSQLLLAMPPDQLKAKGDDSTDIDKTTVEKSKGTYATETQDLAEKASGYSDEERITKLEEQVLKKTYKNDNPARRVERLEEAEFGSPSNSSNLSDRLTILEAYAQNPNLSKQRSASYPEISSEEGPEIKTVSTESKRASRTANPATKNSQSNNLMDRIEAMEREVFGHTYSNRSLLDRLQRLEKEVGLDYPDLAQQDLPSQVAALWKQVGSSKDDQSSLETNRQHKTKAISSFAGNGDLYSFGSTDDNGALGYSNWASGQTQNTESHHSWLQKLGKVLTGMGGLAASALASPSFYPYGYGGMGYGYPYGSYGYPNGIFGNSYMYPGFAPYGSNGGYYPGLGQFGGYYPGLRQFGGGYWGGSPWNRGGFP